MTNQSKCLYCGVIIFSHGKRIKKFCSNTCSCKHKYQKKQVIHSRKCKKCEAEFSTSKSQQVFCSAECYRALENNQWGSGLGFSTGTVGAIAELMASVELMKAGFEVYRALSQSSSCDILGVKDGQLYGFEVRSATATKSGKLSYPTKNIRAKNLVLVIHRESRVVLPSSFLS